MTAKIIPKRSTITGAVPASNVLDIGELAVNATDGIIFTKLPDGNVVNLSGAPELHNHQISQVIGLQDALSSKVDKAVGKGLSTEDYTTANKNKLDSVESGAQVNVPTDLSQSITTNSYTIKSSTGANTTLQPATLQLAGIMTSSDKSKLDTLAATSVTSVNGEVGDVTFTTDGLDEGLINFYFTNARAVAAIKADPDWKDTDWNAAYGWGDHSVAGYELVSNKGQPDGYAGLDGAGKVPTNQLPSSVDDVIEFNELASFPVTGETGKIYVALDTNKLYRWSGTAYVYITSGAVESVNNQTGVVDLTTTNVLEGPEGFRVYFTNARAIAAIKNDVAWNATNWDTAYGWGDHSIAGYELASNKGIANGYAGLDNAGKVPSSQLPSFVDDVLEYASLGSFPATGETGKLYVTLDTNLVYRWSGSTYIEISSGGVESVNSKTGNVVLVSDDIGEGSTNLYFTNTRATTAIKNDVAWNAANWDSAYSWGDHSLVGYELSSNKGSANGYASLDGSGTVPSAQLPASVNDILEYASLGVFPVTGETGKLYVAVDTDKLYRWTGSAYVVTSGSVDSVNGQEGAVVLSTSDIGEGTNLYHTTTRVRNSLSVTGDLSYNASTGVFSFSETYSTPTELLNAIKTVDGTGSGLNADTLDGLNSDDFIRSGSGGSANVVIDATAEFIVQDSGDTAMPNFIWRTGTELRLGSTTATPVTQVDMVTALGETYWHSGNDGVGSNLNADLLDGQHGAYYQNATNLNAGTVATARLPAAALIGDTTYTGGTGITLSGTTFSLSDERYTLAEKNKLAGVQAGAEVNLVNSVNSKTGFVTITASDVGLGAVRNVASYSQTEADGRFVNDTGDSLTGIYRINTPDDGVNDLQVGGNVSLRGQTGFGTDNPTNTVDVDGDVRIRDNRSMKFGGTTASDHKAIMQYNPTSKSIEFNFFG